jgi:hypothetical protein
LRIGPTRQGISATAAAVPAIHQVAAVMPER